MMNKLILITMLLTVTGCYCQQCRVEHDLLEIEIQRERDKAEQRHG